jgi:hypothetical protein
LRRKYNPNSARPRIFDGAAEAKLIALTLSPALGVADARPLRWPVRGENSDARVTAPAVPAAAPVARACALGPQPAAAEALISFEGFAAQPPPTW